MKPSKSPFDCEHGYWGGQGCKICEEKEIAALFLDAAPKQQPTPQGQNAGPLDSGSGASPVA